MPADWHLLGAPAPWFCRLGKGLWMTLRPLSAFDPPPGIFTKSVQIQGPAR